MKRLALLPFGTRIFIDANIFILNYGPPDPLGQACRDFLGRTSRKEVQGFTSALVVSEVIHRAMVREAEANLGLAVPDAVTYLQDHPAVVRQLREHLTVASEIHRLGIDILPITHIDLHASKQYRSAFGLLTNDSLIVAVMRAHKLRDLATHDAGFNRVTGLQVWNPA